MKVLYTISILFSVLLFQYSFAQGPYSGSGNWMELDGVNDYASSPDNSTLDIGLGDGEDFTIECFFYVPDLLGENLEGLVLKEYAYWLYINMNTATPDRILFYIYQSASNVIYADVELTVGWHHIAACYINNTGATNDDMNIFLDGSRIATYGPGTFSYNPGINNGTLSFYAGMYWTGVVNTFHGRIDEMRISDILRYSGLTYTVPSTDFTDDANTRALWHYSEANGSTSFDDASINTNTQTGLNGTQTLPVELSSFSAVVNDKHVILEWQTETEINNYGFDIERKFSEVWEKIGFVQGNGTSNVTKEYSYIDKNPKGGNKFQYRLKQIDNDGHFKYSEIIEVNLIPTEFALYQNYPNPFNPNTKIKYQLPKECKVLIKVYDLLGAEVQEVLNENKEPGIYEIEFKAENLPSGIYLYRVQAGSFVDTKKMILMK